MTILKVHRPRLTETGSPVKPHSNTGRSAVLLITLQLTNYQLDGRRDEHEAQKE